jgi:drug/metabolite transporter (DMT)-like permease
MLWFSLVKVYSASKLSAFSFITPLFGVIGGYFIMHDIPTPAFAVAAVLVIAGFISLTARARRCRCRRSLQVRKTFRPRSTAA